VEHKYEPPDYDLFNLNNGSTTIGTTAVTLLYEGQPNATVFAPSDLKLRVKQLIIQNTMSSPITVQLLAVAAPNTNLPSPIPKTPPIPVNANSAVTLSEDEWSISIKAGYGLAVVSSAASSANVFAKCYFTKGTGSPL